jgi:16S rRNA (uracil1498-N3)-methyltransferase
VHARFHAPDAASGGLVTLPVEEAEHLTRVLRLSAGAAIQVFDGRGHEFRAVVRDVSRGDVRVQVGERLAAAIEPGIAITLAQAILKGDKMDDVVRDAAMMGVAAIQPVVTARTAAPIAALHRGGRRARWERIAISSVKQCGRAVVPAVADRQTFDEVLQALSGMRLPSPALMLVEPGASAGAIRLGDLDLDPPTEATVLIGPEGGWAPPEIERGSAACRLVTLGGRTLRADATAVIALAALFTRWKEF